MDQVLLSVGAKAQYIMGQGVSQFEADVAAYLGTKYAIGVASGTDALVLSLRALAIQKSGQEFFSKDDLIIISPFTFTATGDAILRAGATPLFVDINPDDFNLNIEHAKRVLSTAHLNNYRIVGILPVHLFGHSCDMDAIGKITADNNLFLVEDCAHAIETKYKDQSSGTFGNFGCFSFYVTKNVVTGEGGMIVTNSEQQADRIKRLALHGMSKDAWNRFSDEGYQHYSVEEAGYKYNMMDLQAAIGIHQLNKVEKHWKRRQEIWNYYNEQLKNFPITLPAPTEKNTKHAFHLYTILIDEDQAGITRDEFLNRMQAENIGTGVHYLSIPEHPYYQRTFGWNPEDYPNAKKIGRQTVSLPMSPKLTDDDIKSVVNAIRKIIN